MNRFHETLPEAAPPRSTFQGLPKFSITWIFLALLLTLCAARAQEGPDADYLAIYNVMQQADALTTSGRVAPAHAKYLEALRSLTWFQHNNPNWHTEMVSYRIDYLTDKFKATSGVAVVVADNNVAAPNNAAAPASAPAPDNETAPSATAPSVTAPNAPPSPVKLLDAGSEPRKVLRLHPAVGDKQTLLMTMKMAMSMTAAGKASPAMDMPAMLMTMDLEVKNVSADGEISYGIVFTDADVAADPAAAPGTAEAMKTALASVRGMTGEGRMSDRGVIQGLDMKLPPGANPQLSQTFGQMKDSFSSSAMPLPEEAVGPGAKWEYQTQVKSQGMTIDQIMTFELESIDGDRVTLKSTVSQNAANQKIVNPAMPGLKVDLTRMTGNGTGSSTLDLNHIMAASGTLDENVETVMGMKIGQQPQSMDMKMEMKISIETK